MPGSLARPPQHEHRDKGEEIELTGELAVKQGRSWQRHRWCSHGCGMEAIVQRLQRRGAASCSRPSGQAQHLGGDVGVANLPSNRRSDGGTTTSTEKREEAPVRPAKADQALRARSTRPSSEAMAMNGGEADKSPRSDGSAQRGRVVSP
jgi:hypothetical protein